MEFLRTTGSETAAVGVDDASALAAREDNAPVEGIVQSSLFQIVPRLQVGIELLLIESGGLLEHGGRVGGRSALLLEVSETLAEGKMTGQLDKANEIAALSATVAVKEIFAGVDIERRSGFWMQGTESDELVAVSGGPGGPMLLS